MTELTTTTTDGLHLTVRLPDTHQWVRESLEKTCAAEARRQLEEAPAPDPAYSVPRAADLLDHLSSMQPPIYRAGIPAAARLRRRSSSPGS